MASEANTKRARQLLPRSVVERAGVAVVQGKVAAALDAAEQRGREAGIESAERLIEAAQEREQSYANITEGLIAERDAALAELRRLRERIEKMAEREERYRLDATQRLDDLDAASYDRAARVLRSLLTEPPTHPDQQESQESEPA